MQQLQVIRWEVMARRKRTISMQMLGAVSEARTALLLLLQVVSTLMMAVVTPTARAIAAAGDPLRDEIPFEKLECCARPTLLPATHREASCCNPPLQYPMMQNIRQ
jgi:hypothetical protein